MITMAQFIEARDMELKIAMAIASSLSKTEWNKIPVPKRYRYRMAATAAITAWNNDFATDKDGTVKP